MSDLNGLPNSQQNGPFSLAENVFAVFVSTFVGAFALVAGVILARLLGALAERLGLLTDEGAAWSGLSLDLPIGGFCAGLAFVYCFIRVRRHLQK